MAGNRAETHWESLRTTRRQRRQRPPVKRRTPNLPDSETPESESNYPSTNTPPPLHFTDPLPLYTYQFFYVRHMLESGELGKIQFLRGCHYQDMANWPDYWMGLPPMWYGTHAIGPMVALSGSRICRVMAFGSGTMDESLVRRYGNPFPVETALFEFENGLKGEATRSLFETARVYQEGMFVYGSKRSFEWGFRDWDDPIVTTLAEKVGDGRGRDAQGEVTPMPNHYSDLPEELWHFTVGGNYDPLNPQESLKMGAGGGHHGSHPHLVHEFVTSCIEGRALD